MKKVIFLVMFLLSSFVNAAKLYNHAAAFVTTSVPTEGGRILYGRGFLLTYTDSSDQTNHALISIPDNNYTRDFPLPTGVVNNVKTYKFIHRSGEAETVGFILMKGALYMVPNLGNSTGELQEILKDSNLDVIDVFATRFGLVVVANKKGVMYGQDTVLINMKLIDGRFQLVSSKKLIDEATKSVGYANSSTMDYLVLVTQSNKLVSAIFRTDSGWQVEKEQDPESENFQFKVIAGNNYGSIHIVKYNNQIGVWFLASFTPGAIRFDFNDALPTGRNKPTQFDLAFYDSLHKSLVSKVGNKIVYTYKRLVRDPGECDYLDRNIDLPEGYDLVSLSNTLDYQDDQESVKYEMQDRSSLSLLSDYFLLYSPKDSAFCVAYTEFIFYMYREYPQKIMVIDRLPQ